MNRISLNGPFDVCGKNWSLMKKKNHRNISCNDYLLSNIHVLRGPGGHNSIIVAAVKPNHYYNN